MSSNRPAYHIYAEQDRNNNAVTRAYTGEASSREGGIGVRASVRRDNGRAEAVVIGRTGIERRFEAATWEEAYDLACAFRRRQLVRAG